MEETLGKRIVANRKRIGMTQDKLAEQLGVTAQAVSKWENDLSCPDITMLPKLAELFGISVDALLGCERPQKVHEAELLPVREESDIQEPEGLHIQNGKWEFSYDGGKKSGIALAVWVLLTGGLLLAATILGWDVGLWSILWPSGLLVFGLFELYPRFSFIKLGSALLGGFFLLRNLGVGFFESTVAMDYILPVLLLLFGGSLLAEALGKPRENQFSAVSTNELSKHRSSFRMDDASFACAVAFGGDMRHIQLSRLSGGEAEVSFGELTVDLTPVEEIAENCRVKAECAFGQLHFLVPARWRVELNSDSAFAGIDVKGEPDPNPQAVITMDAEVSFGQITIHYV